MNNKKMFLTLSIFLVLILSGLIQLNKMETEYDEKTIPTTESLGTPKKSTNWDLEFIYINGNWSQTNKTYDWCSGSGTWNDPYVIENVTLSSFSAPTYIYIENTDEPFILNNCTIDGWEGIYPLQLNGISLNNVTNGTIENCNLYFNRNGIKLNNSQNITIRDSQFYYNLYAGINLQYSHNITIIENDESIVGVESSIMGIYLNRSNDNNITFNRIEDNHYGIVLERSNYTEVSHNVLRGNDYCIEQFDSHDNDIKYNDVDCVNPRKLPASRNGDDDDRDLEKWDFLEQSQKYLINPITLLFVYPIFGSLSVIVILQVRGFFIKRRKKIK